MNKRVVITGMGVISPVGNSVNDFRDGIFSGKNGIDKITKFDTEGFRACLAAEVKDFDVSAYMDKNEARKLDKYTQYAIASAM